MVKEHYDLVILDLAPVLEVSDTQILAGEMDGVVLVVRQGVTQKAVYVNRHQLIILFYQLEPLL